MVTNHRAHRIDLAWSFQGGPTQEKGTMVITEQNRLEVKIGGTSLAGAKPENEDAFAAHQPDVWPRHYKGVAAVVADGLSSCDNAQVASQLSVTHFLGDYYATPEAWSVKKSCGRVLTALNTWLFQHGVNSGSHATTFSALIIKSHTCHLFHVGDSRIYLYRDNRLRQLTRDHVQTQGNKKQHLTRALGVDSSLDVDYSDLLVQTGDKLLLTTDGIHDFVSDAKLTELLTHTELSLEQVSEHMCQLAQEKQSQDNLTALIVEIQQLPKEELSETHKIITELPIPPVLKPGQVLDDFHVLEHIYSGTRSHLYLVKDKNDLLKVLKAPSLSFSEDAEYLSAFIREEWIGKRLNHPAIMKIYDIEGARSCRYHICEYIKGISLRQWMTDNPMPDLSQVRELVNQFVQAIRVMQRQDMVHRDLKPENIMFDEQGRVKLIDFGTVLVAGVTESHQTITESCPVGSVEYIAPEYLLGNKGTVQSDIYSMGIIIYEMLGQHLPYQALKPNQYSGKHYSDWKYESLNKHRQDLPGWVDAVLQKACAPNPAKRYSALSELVSDLKKPPAELTHQNESKPLLERDPVKFWQIISLCLLVMLLISWFA